MIMYMMDFPGFDGNNDDLGFQDSLGLDRSSTSSGNSNSTVGISESRPKRRRMIPNKLNDNIVGCNELSE